MKLVKPSHEILSDIDGEKILKNIEIAGRVCYKSEDKISNDSAVKLIKKVLKSGHHSVIEHESIRVRFICDRGVTHEMVRHRLCSISQESTRYCNYANKYKFVEGITFIIPPWVDIKPGEYKYTYDRDLVKERADIYWFESMLDAESVYTELINSGWVAQQARAVLPNSLKTEIILTANIREWRHIFNLRCAKDAHPQIREVMFPVLKKLNEKIPVLFNDIYEKYKDIKM